MKLSIIIPVYNEKNTILEIIKKIEAVDLILLNCQKEIIIVDDYSSDGTREKLSLLKNKYKIIYQNKNYGKGFAIKTGAKEATGEIILIQDADLEYNPEDYLELIKPIITGKAKVVYGSRNLNHNNNKAGLFYYLGGRFLSVVANMLYGLKITDEPTGYKVFRSDIFKNINIVSHGFDFCPEITAKIAKIGINIYEIPIRYSPRTVKNGKKINWRDGFVAIWTLVKYKFIN